MIRYGSGDARSVAVKDKSKAYYEKIKREVRADPRTYERGYMQVISELYGISPSTASLWKQEFNKELQDEATATHS
jgi:hypothetical protein